MAVAHWQGRVWLIWFRWLLRHLVKSESFAKTYSDKSLHVLSRILNTPPLQQVNPILPLLQTRDINLTPPVTLYPLRFVVPGRLDMLDANSPFLIQLLILPGDVCLEALLRHQVKHVELSVNRFIIQLNPHFEPSLPLLPPHPLHLNIHRTILLTNILPAALRRQKSFLMDRNVTLVHGRHSRRHWLFLWFWGSVDTANIAVELLAIEKHGSIK